MRANLGPRPLWKLDPSDRALPFLHDMLTQDLVTLPGDSWRTAVLLTEKGRIRAVLRVIAAGGDIYVECDPAARDGVESGLMTVAGLGGVEVTNVPALLERALTPEATAGASASTGPLRLATPWGEDVLDANTMSAGLTPADAPLFEAARIRAGVPQFGIDVDQGVLLNETVLLDTATSMTKGCYPGQETVAKIHKLGRVRRRLKALDIDGPLPIPNAVVFASDRDGTEVGRVTSAGKDARGVVAFALISVDGAEAGDLTVEGSPASRRR